MVETGYGREIIDYTDSETRYNRTEKRQKKEGYRPREQKDKTALVIKKISPYSFLAIG